MIYNERKFDYMNNLQPTYVIFFSLYLSLPKYLSHWVSRILQKTKKRIRYQRYHALMQAQVQTTDNIFEY